MMSGFQGEVCTGEKKTDILDSKSSAAQVDKHVFLLLKKNSTYYNSLNYNYV